MAHVKLESKYGAVKVRGGNYRARYDDEQRPLRFVLKVAEVTFEDMSSARSAVNAMNGCVLVICRVFILFLPN